MRIEQQGQTLNVSGIRELGAANANLFRDEVHAALPGELRMIEIDLSQTNFVDSCGLGALVSLYKRANQQNGGITVRLLNPTPSVQQVLELTRMHHLFEIVQRNNASPNHARETTAVA
ncbi:MAG: STAS domain-containing protein [Verrucomicrobiota bacterium]